MAKVFADANVLWSPQQRNLLLQLAAQDLFEIYWTDAVIDECDAEDAEALLGGGDQAAWQVPFPAAEARDTLRLGELGAAAHQFLAHARGAQQVAHACQKLVWVCHLKRSMQRLVKLN